MDEGGYKYLDGAHAMYGYSAILPELRREGRWTNEHYLNGRAPRGGAEAAGA